MENVSSAHSIKVGMDGHIFKSDLLNQSKFYLHQKPRYRWTKGQSCTNFQIGPLKWVCSVFQLFPFAISEGLSAFQKIFQGLIDRSRTLIRVSKPWHPKVEWMWKKATRKFLIAVIHKCTLSMIFIKSNLTLWIIKDTSFGSQVG